MNDIPTPARWQQKRPVLVTEVVRLLEAVPPGIVVDGTVGGGGHARAILEGRTDLRLLGIDRDGEAVTAARAALADFGPRAEVTHAGFEAIEAVVEQHIVEQSREEPSEAAVVAVLLDLGVSSHQLDRADRGFSYRADAPLDMRMDRSQPRTAADVVNEYDAPDLVRILTQYGEERFARPIVRRILDRRPLHTTGELVELIKDAIPAPARRRGGHPARRTFQALRMEVNQELAHLDRGLDASVRVLAPRGRLVVLSYHSLEDRMVKRRFADLAEHRAPRGLPPAPDTPAPVIDILTRRAIRASAEEIGDNPRSESVRLRAVEKRPTPDPPGGHAA